MSYADQINALSEGQESAITRDFDLGFRSARAAARCIAAEADARIAALEAENEKLLATSVAHMSSDLADILALQAENAELRKDAERYRWLRQCNWFDSEVCVLRHPRSVLTRGGGGLGADCPSLYR